MAGEVKSLQDYVNELSATVQAIKEEIDIIASGGFMPAGSVYFADLPALIDERYGFVYNIKDAFVTTSDFIEGPGKSYSAGTNVGIVRDEEKELKYDVLASFVDTAAIFGAIELKQSMRLSKEIAGADTVEGALESLDNNIGITIDDELSTTSTNPVQNKVIKGQLDLKLDTDGKANSATSADYAIKAERDGHNNVISSTYATKTELSDGLSGKVNAVAGKGLSSNDYTNEDKDYVDGLPAQLLGKQDKYETITYAQWQAMTPAQQAEKDYYIPDYPASAITAGNVSYDNTTSGIAANKVQGAIDELHGDLIDIKAGSTRLQCVELAPTSQSAGHGGYIDFHYNGSSEYTSRIIEGASGDIQINGISINHLNNLNNLALVFPANDVQDYLRQTIEYIEANYAVGITINAIGVWSGTCTFLLQVCRVTSAQTIISAIPQPGNFVNKMWVAQKEAGVYSYSTIDMVVVS